MQNDLNIKGVGEQGVEIDWELLYMYLTNNTI